MANKAKQNRKEEWERKRVQRVLDCHNNKYGTNIEIKGKSIDIYPCLKEQEKQLNWDWVCREVETGVEVAVEVKRLTDENLEGRQNMLWQLLEEVKDSLSGKLPGTFNLDIDIPPNYYMSLKGHHNKQQFREILYEVIVHTAQTVKLGEDEGLTPQISERLPFALPDSFCCVLCKVNNEGSALNKGSGVTGFWSRRLNEGELSKFEELVSHANEQLNIYRRKLDIKATFLIIIEEGLRLTHSSTIPDAFKSISHKSYSHINHAYYVSGEEVVEIPLPAFSN